MLALLGQLNARWRREDDPGRTDAPAENTGGTWIYASPGLQVSLGALASLYGYVQLPLVQRVNRIQITAPYHLLVGVTGPLGR